MAVPAFHAITHTSSSPNHRNRQKGPFQPVKRLVFRGISLPLASVGEGVAKGWEVEGRAERGDRKGEPGEQPGHSGLSSPPSRLSLPGGPCAHHRPGLWVRAGTRRPWTQTLTGSSDPCLTVTRRLGELTRVCWHRRQPVPTRPSLGRHQQTCSEPCDQELGGHWGGCVGGEGQEGGPIRPGLQNLPRNQCPARARAPMQPQGRTLQAGAPGSRPLPTSRHMPAHPPARQGRTLD